MGVLEISLSSPNKVDFISVYGNSSNTPPMTETKDSATKQLPITEILVLV